MSAAAAAAPTAVLIYADGGSRGNPGPAGYGAVVLSADGQQVLAERSEFLGRATNNVAEYSGLIAGLRAAAELGASRVQVRMDSKLVVEQMSGRWQVKHPDMRPLARTASELVKGFEKVSLQWIPRAQNSYADRLANQAMDRGTGIRQGIDPAVDPAAAPPEPEPELPLEPAEPARRAAGDVAGRPAPHPGGVTTVIFVRHGETTWGALGKFAGREDVELTERGRLEAKAVASRIAPLRPAAVLTSPLQRCRDTAEAIAAAAAWTPPIRPADALLDGALGEWTGCTGAEIAKRWPSKYARWRIEPDSAPPGGESFTAVRKRVGPLITEVVDEFAGLTVVLVSHAAAIKMALVEAFGVPSAVAYRMRVDTASMSAFNAHADGTTVVWAFNETGHLAP